MSAVTDIRDEVFFILRTHARNMPSRAINTIEERANYYNSEWTGKARYQRCNNAVYVGTVAGNQDYLHDFGIIKFDSGEIWIANWSYGERDGFFMILTTNVLIKITSYRHDKPDDWGYTCYPNGKLEAL